MSIVSRPTNHNLVIAANSRGCSGDVYSARLCNTSFDIQIGKEGEVKVCELRDNTPAEIQCIRPMQAHAVLLGLHVARFHVEGERSVVASIVSVDIAMERAT